MSSPSSSSPSRVPVRIRSASSSPNSIPTHIPTSSPPRTVTFAATSSTTPPSTPPSSTPLQMNYSPASGSGGYTSGSSNSSTLPSPNLNHLLEYNQSDVLPGHCTHILWDLREPPTSSARLVEYLDKPLSPYVLSQQATYPSSVVLNISCALFSEPWSIRAYRPEGVMVEDILNAVHHTLQRRISQAEWDRQNEKTKAKITEAFENRCRQAVDPEERRQNGVLRVDFLMKHTWFGGLTMDVENPDTCILTVRRPR